MGLPDVIMDRITSPAVINPRRFQRFLSAEVIRRVAKGARSGSPSPVEYALPEYPAPDLVVPLGFEPCLELTRLELGDDFRLIVAIGY